MEGRSICVSWLSATGTIPASNFSTSWYSTEFDSTATASITATAVYNSTLASDLVQQTQYCWLTDDDLDYLDEEDYSGGCQSLMDEYCFPTAGAPVPPSPSRIPAQCTPDRATYITGTPTSSGSGAGATPSPVQPGIITGCQQFYKVVSGDTCQKVSDAFSISLSQVNKSSISPPVCLSVMRILRDYLTQFYGWNPGVGSNCQALFLGYYVCVSA
ncbi:hypothetical protein PG994_012040 [Apiospora phragmitis]|uniref:LysM domain-containing protein n=1 Tax=Apiospora phragmitis TaxID=2905665 RepID=A0ABR1TUK0_9PEZI